MTKKTRAKARRALLTLSLVLVMMMVAVGGTIAWLTDSTGTVTNTFSPTTININLDETTNVVGNNFDMIPGTEYQKTPYVTVESGSEPCHVFVEVIASENLDTFVNYSISSDWEQVGTTNVYHYKTVVDASETAKVLNILATNENGYEVTINNVTKAQLDNLNEKDLNLEFVAYAVQAQNLEDKTVAELWALANPQND